MTKGFDQFRKFLGRLSVRSGYCVDCLSYLYGDQVETVREYLGETGMTCRQAHCGHCGEHKDIVMPLLPPDLMRHRISSVIPANR